jgi:hypothetical protein
VKQRRINGGLFFSVVMTGLLAIYLVLMGNQGVLLLNSGNSIGVAMGLSLLVFPAIATFGIIREWIFAREVSKLTKKVNELGNWPEFRFEFRPSGRPTRASADAEFARFASAAEALPANWQSWFNLSLAYDAAGDRRRARAAMRKAVALAR